MPHTDGDERYLSVYDDMGGQNRITLIFHTNGTNDCHYEIIDAIKTFENYWHSVSQNDKIDVSTQFFVDEDVVFDAINYMRSNIGCFLTPDDYARIDSLLSDPLYIENSLYSVRQMLSLPIGAFTQENIVADPLNLFSPALQRLSKLNFSNIFDIDENVIFDTEGNALSFIDSPWGSGDTQNNSALAARIDSVIAYTMQHYPNVSITAVGAPLIAVSNANQIKHDSTQSIILSVVIILIILFYSIRKKRNILLLGLSVLSGWLFALALIALVKPMVSIIVIGIGSVLVGIAVNYPLHFIDHLNETASRRDALKEMVEPLVTGNVTTVAAFACLLFVKADAMRDLGLFGSLLLIGTIIFVLIFLPLLAKPSTSKHSFRFQPLGWLDHRKRTSIELEQGVLGRVVFQNKKFSICFLVLVVVATIVFGILSTHTQFDSDLHGINYMTAQQESDLALLNSSVEDTNFVVEYFVSEGSSLDAAINNSSFYDSCFLSKYRIHGIQQVIPSISQQQNNLRGWILFQTKYPNLGSSLSAAARKIGFSDSTFSSFVGQIADSYVPIDPASMSPLLNIATNYIGHNDSIYRVLSMVLLPKSDYYSIKDSLRTAINDDNSFVFDIGDIGVGLTESLNKDFNYILFVCGFVVFAFLWISFGRIELAIISFLPMIVGWLWILGIMDIAAVKFNIVNIILATFIFGQGDDYTIFITEGLIYENAYGKRRLMSYRRSVIISALLMFVGIGTLIFAKHPALRSLAEVVIIGMIIVVVMACYLPPLIFRWMLFHKGKKRDIPITLLSIVKTSWLLLMFFLFTFVVGTPCTILYRLIGKDSEKKRLRYHQMICRCARIAIRHLPGVAFDYENDTNENFSKPAVIVANHQSHLDLLCVMQLCPKLVILTNDWVWRNPMYGLMIRYAEFLPVSKGYDNILPQLKSLITRGYSILVFPEGTRSVDGSIGRFHQGAFKLAQQLNVDILPVFIHGANHVMPKNDIFIRNGKITVELQSRFLADKLADSDTISLTTEFHRFYQNYFRSLSKRIEDEQYWLPYLMTQYMYKGRSVASRAHTAIARYLSTGEFTLNQGEIPILKALANKDKDYLFSFDNEDDFRVASNCAILPNNIHFTLTERFSQVDLPACR
ncbi:MAG: 1-acyl-sn-glycerol-3-phosphate acyltransferase [Bacteroidales bacterium]|nr:1-acyl-sn-glycerol-3-phosphate acyltransferase [Candidatus Colimorpha onthohippi]